MNDVLPQHPRLFSGRRWTVSIAIVTAIAMVQLLPPILAGHPAERIVLQAMLWLLETPLQIAALSAAFDWGTRRKATAMRMLAESIFISVVIGATFLLMLVLVAQRWIGIDLGSPTPIPISTLVIFGAVVGLFLCGIWALAFVLPYTAEQSRLRTLEAERLALEASHLRTAAQMATLRSQLEPHFLLNTLNMIAGLVTQEPREARRLIGCLGDLLRDSLSDAEEAQPLDGEITWLQRYAEILSSRHGKALHFEWAVADEARSTLVPRLLLQPLVENAVKHGALRRSGGGGRVTVSAVLQQELGAGGTERLVCTIKDNGPGLASSEPRPGAFGLRSVRERLRTKSPDARFELHSSAEGTEAVVTLPIVRSPRGKATKWAPEAS